MHVTFCVEMAVWMAESYMSSYQGYCHTLCTYFVVIDK